MPNYCDFKMKVTGEKENIETFLGILKEDYSYPDNVKGRHLCRVFEADAYSMEDTGSNYECLISGYCAWSVYCCMMEGEHTYYNSLLKEYGENCKATTLPQVSKDLDLSIEVYSEEPGVGFQEHFLISKGEVVTEEECDYQEIYFVEYKGDSPTQEDVDHFNQENGTWYKLEDYDVDRLSFITGGFENHEFSI